MNPKLFTEEFRTFKFLTSPAHHREYYKKVEQSLNQVRPIDKIDDDSFIWNHRIEFLDQLIDLAGSTIWMVDTNDTLVKTGNSGYDYDLSRLIEIEDLVIYKGFPKQPGRFITVDDIPSIESLDRPDRAFISNRSFYLNVGNGSLTQESNSVSICFGLYSLPILPSSTATYNALFYNKNSATMYQHAVTNFLRKNNDAISAISRML